MLSATTHIDAQVLISESFDGSTFVPSGWTLTPGSSGLTWGRYTVGAHPTTVNPHSGAGMAGCNSWSVSSGTADLVSPVMNFASPGGRKDVKIWVFRDGGLYQGYNEGVSMYINTSPTAAGGTLLGTVNRAIDMSPTVTATGWYEYTYVVPSSFTGTTNYLIMQGWSAYGNDTYIDDISVTNIVLCPTPTGTALNNVASTTANFSWNALPGVLGYEYEVTQSATAPVSGTFTNTNTGGLTGLTPSTAYYLHVRTKCGATDFSAWASVPFTTTAANPCAAPNGLTTTATGVSTIDLSWNSVGSSQGYEYIISQSGQNPTTAGTPSSATSASASGLTAGASYYLYVRNVCTQGASWSDWTRKSFTMPTCDMPSNIIKTNVTDVSADVIWAMMPNAAYYEYQVDQVRTPPVGGSGFNSTTGMTTHVSGLSNLTTYYIHIRSRCFSDDSSAWALDSFYTQMGCASPQLVINNANTSSPYGSWNSVVGAIAYEYEIRSSATVPAFGIEIYDTKTPILALPFDNRDYYLHVRAKCNSMFSFSNWSTAPLRLQAAGVSSARPEGFGIAAYPNPMTDKLSLNVQGDVSADAAFTLTDMQGRVVRTVRVTANVTETNIADLPAGIYLLKYTDGGHIDMLKLNKQ